MTESYADAPFSIGEIRASKEEDCSKWTPRDVLISMLREIDSGKLDCDALVVCYSSKSENGKKTLYAGSSPDGVTALGILSRVSYIINMGTS